MTTLLVSPFGMKVRQGYPSNDFSKAVDQFIRQEAVPAIKNVTNSIAVPAVNIKKTDTAYELQFSIPGFSKENVKVTVENNLLTVEGSKEQSKAEGEKIIYKEFRHQDFKRTFNLGEEIDKQNVEAAFNAGILTVTLGLLSVTEKQNKINISIN